MTIAIHHGDSREVLRTMPDACFHSVVCDPPYSLVSIQKRFGKPGSAAAQGGVYNRSARGFMGKSWDTGETAFDPAFWAEVYRVLKPGGHMIAFGGTRTYHRLACAIEDGGFEVRDMLAWMFGSGFPKSHNVAKGIAKRRVEDVEPVRVVCRAIRAAMIAKGLTSADLAPVFDCHSRLIDHWAARDTDSQPSLPMMPQWFDLKRALDMGDELDAEVGRLNERKGTHGERWADAPIVGENTIDSPGFGDHRFTGDRSIRDLDAAASAWEGWGTALKPAHEPICLARKPLAEGTVAANVLAHGCGAINVDACRVEAEQRPLLEHTGRNGNVYGSGLEGSRAIGTTAQGRWPANVVHDGSEEVIAAFPETVSGSGSIKGASSAGYQGNALGKESRPAGTLMVEHPDKTGSAARFFYSAKADAGDRLQSKHPTVKPVNLMRWLVRLVTPKGGHVLDPFAGSGTTGMACMAEGFDCTLIERESEYVADIRRRIAHVDGADTPLFSAKS